MLGDVGLRFQAFEFEGRSFEISNRPVDYCRGKKKRAITQLQRSSRFLLLAGSRDPWSCFGRWGSSRQPTAVDK
jgi:hypothetical protein